MTDTITALQERIEESKMPDIDILDTILQNQLVYMSAQIEILNKLAFLSSLGEAQEKEQEGEKETEGEDAEVNFKWNDKLVADYADYYKVRISKAGHLPYFVKNQWMIDFKNRVPFTNP